MPKLLNCFVVMLTSICGTVAFGNEDDIVRRYYKYQKAAFQRLSDLDGLRIEMKTKRWADRYDELKEYKYKSLSDYYFALMEKQFLYHEPKNFDEEWTYRWDPSDSMNPSKTRWICYAPEKPKESFLKLRGFSVIDKQIARMFVRGDLTIAEEATRLKPTNFKKYADGAGYDLPLDRFRMHFDGIELFGRRMTSFAGQLDFLSCPQGVILSLDEQFALKKQWGLSYSERDISVSGYDCVEFTAKSDNYIISNVYLKAPKIGFVSCRQEGPLGILRYHETDELAEFEGIVYPKKGHTHIRNTSDYAKVPLNYHFEFDVTSVNRLSTEEMTPWMIEYPEGTAWVDINNLSQVNPFPVGFTEQRMQQYLIEHKNKNKYSMWWMSGFVAITMVFALGYVVHRRRQA